jgi:hypothetical protein
MLEPYRNTVIRGGLQIHLEAEKIEGEKEHEVEWRLQSEDESKDKMP